MGFKKYLPAGYRQIPYTVYDGLTFKLAAKKAHAVIVSSKFEYEDAVEFGIDKKKLHVIPMGIDIEDFPRRDRENNEVMRILFVGRLARVRRVELLLQAAKKLSIPYRVTIVGGEEETASLAKSGYLNELKKLCEDLGIKRHVTFAGAQSPEAVKTCYRNADVFVYPSLYENFGQPILEAAAAGLAIISTNVGIAKEIIRDGENGFIVDGDPEVIKDRMEALAALQSRTTFGKRIQEKVRKDLAWDRIIQRYAEIYRSL